jgi:hypothetical protein
MMIAPEVQVDDDMEMDEQGGKLDLIEDREEPDMPVTPVEPPTKDNTRPDLNAPDVSQRQGYTRREESEVSLFLYLSSYII